MRISASFALLALLAMAGAASASRELQTARSLLACTGGCKDKAPAIVVLILDNCSGPIYSYLKKYPKQGILCVNAIKKALNNPKAVATSTSIGSTILGNVNSGSNALAMGNPLQDAEAVAKSVATTVQGQAVATSNAGATSLLGDAKAFADSIATACVGVALSTSSANVETLFGNGFAKADSKALTVIGDALAQADATCISKGFGGCTAVSNAVGQTTVGNVDVAATSVADCSQATIPGPCNAVSTGTGISTAGNVNVVTSSVANGK